MQAAVRPFQHFFFSNKEILSVKPETSLPQKMHFHGRHLQQSEDSTEDLSSPLHLASPATPVLLAGQTVVSGTSAAGVAASGNQGTKNG